MALDMLSLALSQGYTDETVLGGGALKGKNCVVSNIEEVADGVNVTFQWTLDNGTVQTDTAFIPRGTQGEAGVDGKSAYEIWLEAGNTGTEQDFLSSLVGEKGADGTMTFEDLTEEQKESLKGEQGEQGEQGEAGKSAYQVWLDEGNTGSEEDFLNSLKGEKGADGTMTFADLTEEQKESLKGADGQDGVDGVSPLVEIVPTATGNTINITDKDGLKSFDVVNGVDGQNGNDGADGFAPVVTVTEIEGGHKVVVEDVNGQQEFEVLDGKDAEGKVYTSLSELGLDTTATINDIIGAMANGSQITYKTDVFDYATEYENLQFATVTIHKQGGNRVQVLMTDKDTGNLYVGRMDNTNKIVKWAKMITNMSDPYACTSYTALTGTEDLFTLPCGHYVSANINTAYNYPITDTNVTAHIYVLGCLNDPANNKGYRIILYFDNKGRMYRINEWWGVFTDNGWQEIATKSTYNSIAELNRAKGTSIELVNGEDNTQKIVDALSVGEQFVSFYHNNANQNRFGIDTGYGSLINEIRIVKCLDADLTAKYAIATAFMNTGVTMSRIYYKTYSTDWCVNGTITLLSQLGLTSSATVDDVHNKLKVGQMAILSVQAFDNYQTLFPYADSNDQYARVEIQKGESVAHSRIFWWRKDGSRFAIGNINSSNKLGGWFEYALKSYVDSAVNGGTLGGKAIKSVEIDLSDDAYQPESTAGIITMPIPNLPTTAKVIRAEGYYEDVDGDYFIVSANANSGAGTIKFASSKWCIAVNPVLGGKNKGFAKIYYTE